MVLKDVTGTFTANQSITSNTASANIASVISREVRFRITDLMSERNFGQLSIDPGVRYEISGEVHNNSGGNGSRPMIVDNSIRGGLARIKCFRGGNEQGSSVCELRGNKGIWDIQVQSNQTRGGHILDLYGTDYLVDIYMEKMQQELHILLNNHLAYILDQLTQEIQ
jgi:hypothetical protein